MFGFAFDIAISLLLISSFFYNWRLALRFNKLRYEHYKLQKDVMFLIDVPQKNVAGEIDKATDRLEKVMESYKEINDPYAVSVTSDDNVEPEKQEPIYIKSGRYPRKRNINQNVKLKGFVKKSSAFGARPNTEI